jgi:hypothetical protein
MTRRPTVLLLRRLRPLLDRTLDLDPGERAAFLARLAREEPADARELAALLVVEPALDAARFLYRDPSFEIESPPTPPPAPPPPPSKW